MWAPTKTLGSAAATPPKAPYDFDEENPNNLSKRAVDNLRPVKVMVLGAGMSGILAGILFPRSVRNLELVIYEKNPDLGGTWYESRYYSVEAASRNQAYLSS